MAKDRKLKVGLVFDDSLDSNDGVAQHVKTVGAWLVRQGHEVDYLVGETKIKQWAGGRVLSLSNNQKVKFNSNRLSVPIGTSSAKIKQLLENNRYDVLHVMMPFSPLMGQKIVRHAAPNTAIIGTFHIYPAGLTAAAGTRLLRLAYGSTLKKFTTFISVSTAAADFARRSLGIRSTVIPNPVDVSFYRSILKPMADNDRRRIVFLGRLVKRKGCRQLIEAFARLSRKVGRVELIIAGTGSEERKLKALVRKRQIADRIEFLGFIEESEKPALLASADIACFPSLFGESFGIVLVEAMAAGAGVVLGGDNPGYRTVLKDQPKLLVDPNDSAGFAARLDELLSNKRTASAIHKWQETQVSMYDIETVGRQILKIYDDSIARLSKT